MKFSTAMCDVNGAAEEWSSRRICCRRGDGVSGVEKKTALGSKKTAQVAGIGQPASQRRALGVA
jgi:hypothetical protein